MALNITFSGNIYDSEGIQINDNSVRYQAYFKKVNAGSSSNKWNNSRISEYGQYSLNLGDGDLLTQDGKASVGDKVIILFWREKKEVKESSVLKEWCFVETTLNAAEVYLANIKLSKSIKPNNSFVQSGIAKVNKQIIITDNGSNDNHSYTFGTTTLKQTAEFFPLMNTLPNNCITINWGDQTLEQTFNAGVSANHSYKEPGDYVISIKVTNSCGLFTISTFNVRVYWNEPIVDFKTNKTSFLPQGENGKGEEIICTNTTTNPDDRDIVDKWYYIYEFNQEPNPQITKEQIQKFCAISQGIQTIKLNCYWYNGFEYKLLSVSKTVNQETWSIQQNLIYDEPIFINKSNKYQIELYGDSEHFKNNDIIIDNEIVRKPLKNEIFSYTFITAKQQKIKSIIYYHNGFEVVTAEDEYILNLASSCSFSHEKIVEGMLFTNTSIIGSPPIKNLEWKVTDESNNLMAFLKNSKTFIYTLFKEGKYNISLTITDSNNSTISANGDFIQTFNASKEQIIYISEMLKLEIIEPIYTLAVDEEIITIEIEEDEE